MRVLVTGAAGFVGSHLCPVLPDSGASVVGLGHAELDVRDHDAVERVVAEVRPDRVYHLAAQSRAARSWTDPALTYAVNVVGTHNLLDALRRHVPDARVLITATSDEYGAVEQAKCPINEATPLRPVSPYAASKVAQEWVGKMFHEAFGSQVVTTRAFMHVGPGQPPTFATADWARQIALAEIGRADPAISVGNVDVVREFGDVRDVVRAYRALLEGGRPGDVYNVATGEGRSLRDALGVLAELATVDVEVTIDPAKIRPADPPMLVGSAAKLERATGWKPEHRLEDTLAEVLDYWRAQVRRE